ncbi:DNA polymerase I [Candidatus Saccharibacteria bacterium]|nr:DNA polymerase I [Candidatus Saccharibacteria bacterium]
MTKRLVLIDGMSVFYRGFFAMPGLSLPDGTPTGGVFGFASIAVEVIKKLEPDYVAVAWDIKGTSTAQRSKIFADYKAGRSKPPDDFYTQLPILHELLESFGWPLYELDGYEADDIMGTFALAADKEKIETCLVTGDYDMMQLISSHTNVYITKKGSELIKFDDEQFFAKYGVHVRQFVDYKALVGDSSDNIPGVRGVGPKAAASLLGQYDTLDGIYEHVDEQKGALKDKLVQGKESAYMSRDLARIFTDAPIAIDWHEADVNNTNLEAVASKLKALEFHSLIKRLPRHMQQTADTSLYFHAADEVQLTEVGWPSQVEIDGPIIVQFDGNEVWVSLNDRHITHTPLAEIDESFWRAIEWGTVISYDAKQLYHDLAAHGISVRFSAVHDVRQASFLIDPLKRDRSLAGLVGNEVGSPTQEIAATWQVYNWQVAAFKEKPKVQEIAEKFDFPLIYHLFMMEHRGIKVNVDFLKTMSSELGQQHATLEQEMYTMAGTEFNIGSPAQLSEVLFTKLQLPTFGIKKGKTGYSTDQKTLDKLKGQHPIIELIEQTRELAKLKNTYLDTLPEQIDKHSRIHTTFNQDVAPTGRLSSVNPNLQNIPVRTELGRKIREAFVPEPGNVFVSADYSQFELRLAAVLAGDTQMIADFESDIDIHAKTAADVRHIPLSDVTKDMRRDAKVVNFGVLYGMGPHALAGNTGMTFGEAKEFIEQYFELRKPIREFIDSTLKKAETEGYVETLYGRRRPTPDIKSSNFMVREAAKRAAFNMPIQGTEADIMKLAMIKVDEKLGDLGEQLLQIHDSILVECSEKNAEQVSEILKDTMESIAPDLGISLKVDVHVGTNWGEV